MPTRELNRVNRGLTGLGLTLLACCAAPAAAAEVTDGAVRQGVQSTLDAYRAAGMAGRWDDLLHLYADDPRFLWVTNGRIEARSVADLRKYFLTLPPQTRVETTFEDVEVAALGKDLATAVTRYQTKVVDPVSGGFSFGGVLTMIFLRTADGWKILSGHSSSPVRPPSS